MELRRDYEEFLFAVCNFLPMLVKRSEDVKRRLIHLEIDGFGSLQGHDLKCRLVWKRDLVIVSERFDHRLPPLWQQIYDAIGCQLPRQRSICDSEIEGNVCSIVAFLFQGLCHSTGMIQIVARFECSQHCLQERIVELLNLRISLFMTWYVFRKFWAIRHVPGVCASLPWRRRFAEGGRAPPHHFL